MVSFLNFYLGGWQEDFFMARAPVSSHYGTGGIDFAFKIWDIRTIAARQTAKRFPAPRISGRSFKNWFAGIDFDFKVL